MKTRNTFLTVVACVLLLTGITNTCFGQDVLESFNDPRVLGTYHSSVTVQMEVGSNLMIEDPNTGEITSVGLDGSSVHLGYLCFDTFIDTETGEEVILWYFVGFGDNILKHIVGKEGRIYGEYTQWIQDDPDKQPKKIIVVIDPLNDGIGTIGENGWVPGPDDIVYDTDDILFGPDKIRGAIELMPYLGQYYGIHYLPEMVISPYTPKYYGLEDLANLATYWLAECSGECPDKDFRNADMNSDEVVNLLDFAELSKVWLSEKPE